MPVREDDTDDQTPEDTFALVGNEIRAAILQALGDARSLDGPRPVLSFAELRAAIRLDVRSSQFNYHLQQLVGQFVEDVGDGYRLRPAGTALYRSMRAETFDRDLEIDPFEVGVDCYFCETAVTAQYQTGTFTIQCPGCEHRYFASTRVPPSGVEDTDALLSRIHRHDRHKLLAFTQQICPTCANDLNRRLLSAEEAAFSNTERAKVYVFHACDHCKNQDYRTVGESLLYRPEVSCFLADRDLDVMTTPRWELEFAATDSQLTVDSTDPWRLELTLARHGDVRRLTVDGTLDIRECRDE